MTNATLKKNELKAVSIGLGLAALNIVLTILVAAYSKAHMLTALIEVYW